MLDKTQFNKFLQLIAEARNSGDFEIYLGLNRREIELLKRQLNIDSSEDARKMLQNVAEYEKKYQEIQLDEQRKIALTARLAAEKRLKEFELQKQTEKEKRIALAKKVLNVSKIKKQDSARQKKFAASQQPKLQKEQSAWHLSDEDTPEQFQQLLVSRGWGFIRDKYGISNQDIKNEVLRLKLKVNFDLIPR